MMISTVSTPAQAAVKDYLPHIMDRVRQCSIIPVSHNKEGHGTNHAMISHCPEVKVLAPNKAKIKVMSHIYTAQITDSVDSDGDLSRLVITDMASNEQFEVDHVLAFGDILLGVLMGNTHGVYQANLDDANHPLDEI